MMANTLNIDNAQASQLSTRVEDYEIAALSTDGATSPDETEYVNTEWAKYWGYFNAVPDLKSAIILKSVFNVGKGYNSDTETEVILDHISGWGKDSFEDILFNMDVIRSVGGDSFAEIIKEDNTLINLKPLDPGSIRIVVDKKGVIVRYEQFNKVGSKKEAIHKFKPEEIFHLSNNRLADQIHGISDIKAVEKTILADEQNFDDINKVMHRQAKPMIMFKLGSDNQAIIDAFVAKMDAATNKGENIYIPDDANSVSFEVVQVNPSSLLMSWRDELRNRFYRVIGLPQVVPGAGGQSTESESKTIYLAFEGIVEARQRYLEKQIWNQLNLKIDLIPPASMQPGLANDTMKDGQAIQPGDTQAGVNSNG